MHILIVGAMLFSQIQNSTSIVGFCSLSLICVLGSVVRSDSQQFRGLPPHTSSHDERHDSSGMVRTLSTLKSLCVNVRVEINCKNISLLLDKL